jgi:serine/threonine protein phosphatase 1
MNNPTENNYLKIDGRKYKKIFVVGDLHGCHDKLITALFLSGFNHETDLVISVGDLIDRGEQSIECLLLLDEPWFTSVRGNHEQMAIDGIKHAEHAVNWMNNGGHWYFKLDESQKKEADRLINKSSELPFVIEVTVNKKKYVIAHADYPCNEYRFGKSIDVDKVIWSRERIENEDQTTIKNAYLFIFGHTPVDKQKLLGNRMYIDAGAVFGGNLTVIRIK